MKLARHALRSPRSEPAHRERRRLGDSSFTPAEAPVKTMTPCPFQHAAHRSLRDQKGAERGDGERLRPRRDEIDQRPAHAARIVDDDAAPASAASSAANSARPRRAGHVGCRLLRWSRRRTRRACRASARRVRRSCRPEKQPRQRCGWSAPAPTMRADLKVIELAYSCHSGTADRPDPNPDAGFVSFDPGSRQRAPK